MLRYIFSPSGVVADISLFLITGNAIYGLVGSSLLFYALSTYYAAFCARTLYRFLTKLLSFLYLQHFSGRSFDNDLLIYIRGYSRVYDSCLGMGVG